MSKRFLGPANRFAVGIGFDATDLDVVAAAAALAGRTRMTARLVHALAPLFGSASVRHSPLAGLLEESAAEIWSQRHAATIAGLGDRAACLPPGTPYEVAAVPGSPAAALIADAVTTDARLLLVGGGSTAQRLLAEAPLPVLAIPHGFRLQAGPERLSILIADDLSAACEPVAQAGLDLARALGNADVTHLHVSAVTAERVERLAVWAANALRREGRTLEPREVVRQTEAIIADGLARRAASHAGLLGTTGGTYSAVVTTAHSAREEIAAAAQRVGADLIVCGRHRAMHLAPFRLGRVPGGVLAAQERAVLVVPLT
jgi:nucleotide-binding universal stress UspA family protein